MIENNRTLVSHNAPSPAGPEAGIDWEEVQRLAQLNCTIAEIAFALNISRLTLHNRCLKENKCSIEYFAARYSRSGNISLRRLQWKILEGGYVSRRATRTLKDGTIVVEEYYAEPNCTMAIFLGKNQLGQGDRMVTEVTGRDGGPVQAETTIKVVSEEARHLTQGIISGQRTG